MTDIPIKKELRFYGASQYYRSQLGTPLSNQKVSVFLEIANTEQHRLGMPLPKGTVRVYKASSDGSLQFIGEDVIDHTPKDEKVKIKMGEAFDVVGERTQRDWKKIASGVYETEWDVEIRNHKKEDVQVTIVEPVPGDWEVHQEQPPLREDRGPHPPVRGEGPQGRQDHRELPRPDAVVSALPADANGPGRMTRAVSSSERTQNTG